MFVLLAPAIWVILTLLAINLVAPVAAPCIVIEGRVVELGEGRDAS